MVLPLVLAVVGLLVLPLVFPLVPPVLQALDDPGDDLQDVGGTRGCAFCDGLGHRITECP